MHVRPRGDERDVSWLELDRRSNQIARMLQDKGVDQGSLVVVALANSAEHFFVDFAVWKLGAMVLPLRWDLPEWERQRLLHLARPSAIVAIWSAAPRGTVSLDELAESIGLDDSELPDRIPNPARVIATSGSTGSPKLIVSPVPGIVGADPMAQSTKLGQPGTRTTQLVISPLYHTNGFSSFNGLLEGQKLVVMERFDAGLAADLIEAHRVNTAIMVPTMLSRIAELNGVQKRDFSSINAILYGGAAIASSVVRQWFSLVGPEHFIFSYGGTESIGLAMARGDEWIQHEGTVGRPVGCEILILDDQRRQLDVGQVGNVFLRRMDGEQGFRYLGAESPRPTADGFSTYGDLGWLDKDGYLFIADRRVDMIVSGGANVYPAEVELALADHESVGDIVVIGLPDEEWGHRVHAIVEPTDMSARLDQEELRRFAGTRLAAYKVPKTIEFVDRIPRSDAGKINRSALVAERTGKTDAPS